MKYVSCTAIGVASVVVLAAPALAHSSSGTPRAQARALLRRCLSAANGLQVSAVTLNTPQVPQRNRAAARVNSACDITGKLNNLAYHHQRDKALERAYTAGFTLGLGIGDYVQYLSDAAFGRQNRTELRRAIREVRSGKVLTRRSIAELS
jgi:hypothetical protein